MANIIGIDLGTTYSAVAKINDAGKAEIVPDGQGDNITPSVVEFTGKEKYSVGATAKKMSVVNAKNCVPSAPGDEAKRHMGSTEKIYEIFGEKHTPVSISALILKKLKEDFEEVNGDIDTAVVTVPANFANEAREATAEAAKLAGLNVENIINEPTAATFACSVLSGEELSGKYVIYDFGGGTFDCSIAEVQGQEIEILTSEGVQKLGGKDVDLALINLVAKKYKEETGKDLNSRSYSILQAEEDKKSLSDRESILVSINQEGFVDITITRDDFEEVISSLVLQAEMAVEVALDRLDLKPDQITDTVLVGGSTRIPLVKKSITKIFGREPKLLGNPDEMVALGAAIYATYKADGQILNPLQRRSIQKMNIQEVTGQCFGVEVHDAATGGTYNLVIINRNEKIPCSITESLYTIADNQTAVNCHVTSHPEKEEDLTFVRTEWKGKLDLPSGRPQGQEIKVTYSYTEDQRMRCIFLDVASGNETSVDLDELRKSADKSTADIDQFKVE